MRKFKIILVTTVLVLFTLRFQSVIKSLGSFYLTLEPLFLHPQAIYDEKMSMKYPVYFDFILKVKSITPNDSTIYVPSIEIPYVDKMWPIVNIPISSAFLFPRKIVYFSSQNITAHDKNSFLVISDGFPEEKIQAKYVYLLGKSVEKFSGNYNPLNFNKSDNGLIKL